MTGGGSFPQPGEISLAHNGILYLDELPEYSRNVLEVLRQPLEDRKITVSRIRCNVEYPASFYAGSLYESVSIAGITRNPTKLVYAVLDKYKVPEPHFGTFARPYRPAN